MYRIIALLSLFIRQFCLSNPFECFGDQAVVYNWIAGILLHPIAYFVVGQIYESGSAPVVGSCLYLLAYCVLTGFLWILGLFSFAWWAIVVAIFLFITCFCAIRYIRGDI